jgi:hypothetical protein
MSTTQKALDQVETRHMAYWKLYRGADRVAQCDRDENPNADPVLAFEAFQQELEYLADEPGQYKVNVYKNLNGEKGGFKYSFTIFPTEQRMNVQRSRSVPSALDETLYDRIKRDVEMDLRLKRIEEKIDGIIELIHAKTTEGKEDDDKALALITGLAGQAFKQKAAIGKSGAFSNM